MCLFIIVYADDIKNKKCLFLSKKETKYLKYPSFIEINASKIRISSKKTKYTSAFFFYVFIFLY